jgi:putative ABC transport system permease protein
MYSLIQDVHFSLRLMRKRPGMTFLVIAALVLGIGLNTAIFSVVNAVLLRPLPVFEPDRVVWLKSKVNRTGSSLGTSYPDYLDWKSQSRSFEALAAMRALSFTLTGNGPPEHLKGTGISASGFKTWGVTTIWGRDFRDDDDRTDSPRAAILNYAFWKRKFGGDPAVLGKSLVLDDQLYSIIGVLQPTQISVLRYPDVWVANGPLVDQHIMERDTRLFFPVARLKANVSQVQAQAEMETIASRLSAQYPATNQEVGIRLVGVVEQLTADGRKPLSLMLVASGLILLLACVNVMVVFLGSTVERGRELALRLALGAARSDLQRQLFVQAVIFAGAGSALGLLLAKLGLALFLQRFPAAVLRFQETTIDLRVILFTVGMALAASLAAIVAPSFYAFHLKINSELKGEWRWLVSPKYRVCGRGALVLFEVSLASALALVSGLLIKSFYEVEKVDLGFNPQQVFSFQINLPATHYQGPAKQAAFYRLALEKLVQLPGMESTSAISGLPLTTQGEVNNLDVDGQSPLSGEHLLVEDESIVPGFFHTMKLPLLQGRDFTDADRDATLPVAIVDDVLAAKLWPGQDPVGKRVRMTDLRKDISRWREVVGVARQIKHFGPEAKVRWMQVYVPQYQDATPMLSFVINTTLPEAAVKTAVDKAFQELDKDISVENFQTMDRYLDTFRSGRKVTLLLLSSFAAIGIVLGIIGIYGVVSNAVVGRRREIAIRMALGATARGAMVLVTRLGLVATVGGIAAGSAIVIGMTRLISSFLFGVTALDPAVYFLSAAILMVLALMASLLPAMRLLRFNIQDILRE